MSGPAHAGSCHCGAIGFTYRTPTPTDRWALRACQCSFCRAHDALTTSEPTARIDFHASRPADLQRYRFGLRTADFLLCRRCGVYIGALIETDDGSYGIINVHALSQRLDPAAPAERADYEGEDAGARVHRRRMRWSPATFAPSG